MSSYFFSVSCLREHIGPCGSNVQALVLVHSRGHTCLLWSGLSAAQKVCFSRVLSPNFNREQSEQYRVLQASIYFPFLPFHCVQINDRTWVRKKNIDNKFGC